MTAVRKLPKGSFFRGRLPRGCRLCEKGAKMVLLVTGRCGAGCWYCPLSAGKSGKDVIFADEMKVKKDNDILVEARLIDALGTGITGGDPLRVPGRTTRYIRLLKKRFGPDHHIHLYTAGNFQPDIISGLAEAGLDEIRFHPAPKNWTGFGETKAAEMMKAAIKFGLDTGVEVPAIPGKHRELVVLAKSLDTIGAGFLNLNELEYSETNYKRLNARGFTVRDDISSGVMGSEKTARKVFENSDVSMTLHFCSSGFKDAIQLRRRIMRRALNTARPYQVITRDGTLLTGIVEGPPSLVSRLIGLGMPEKLVAYNRGKKRAETAPVLVEKLAHRIGKGCFIIEEYPTADGLEVERMNIG